MKITAVDRKALSQRYGRYWDMAEVQKQQRDNKQTNTKKKK